MKWDIGAHSRTVPCEMDGHSVEVVVLDAPGQEEHAMIDRYAYSADCVLLCFALDFPTSLENVMDKASNIPEMLEFTANISVSGFTVSQFAAIEYQHYS